MDDPTSNPQEARNISDKDTQPNAKQRIDDCFLMRSLKGLDEMVNAESPSRFESLGI